MPGPVGAGGRERPAPKKHRFLFNVLLKSIDFQRRGRSDVKVVTAAGVTAAGVTAAGVTAAGVTAARATAAGVTAAGVTAAGVMAAVKPWQF